MEPFDSYPGGGRRSATTPYPDIRSSSGRQENDTGVGLTRDCGHAAYNHHFVTLTSPEASGEQGRTMRAHQ